MGTTSRSVQLTMLTKDQLLVGGVTSAVISVIGSVISGHTLFVLSSSKPLRHNPTMILILVILLINLFFTAIVLPLNSVAMLNTEFMASHNSFCSIFAILYYWTSAALLFAQAALAVNRWSLVCTLKFRFTKKTSLVAGALSWGLSALILLIPVFVGIGNRDPEFGYNQESGTCTILKKPDQYIIFSFCIVIPYGIILMCYSSILSRVRKSKKNIEFNKRLSVGVNIIETQTSLD